MRHKLSQMLYGVASSLPGVLAAGDLYCRLTNPATASARYCYSVWLRHLTLASQAGLNTSPARIAELGPGRSLGIGLAALLCGAEQYRGLDVVAYASAKSNVPVFDELVRLFRSREEIPGDDEFPGVYPKFDSYAFPSEILSPERMASALAPDRVAALRKELWALDQGENGRLAYWPRWTEEGRLRQEASSVDMILSQAVLEHVNDLPAVYEAMTTLLAPGGTMSHQIDFTSHGMAREANGHWGYSDRTWKLIVGKRPYAINRASHETHHRLIRDMGLRVVADLRILDDAGGGIPRARLAPRFAHLSDASLRCRGTCLILVKDAL
ncbi:MAG: methyltransferase domain-containing protein [Deltaproteobacteria bacterium]|nr:methyltransferase domain-containing protein [Deltaproteobacteria bacterium]